MPSYGEYQQPAGKMLSCGCMSGCECKNKKNIPFFFNYLTYKPNTDILTESQQYRLCLDLLNEGHVVYCGDSSLKDQCDSRILYEKPTEQVFEINL